MATATRTTLSSLQLETKTIHGAIEELLNRMDKFDSRLDEVKVTEKAKIAEVTIAAEDSPCNTILDSISDEFSQFKIEVRDQIAEVKNIIQRMTSRVSHLEKVSTKMDDRLDELEQYSRRNCLLIHGLRETENENCIALASSFLSSQLRADIHPLMLDRVHRIGQYRDARHRPVIVKFINYPDRSRVWRAKKSLKGTGFVITESLTSNRMKLLKEARDLFGRSKVWTFDGKIVVVGDDGKRIFITTSSELDAAKSYKS